jgi:hypothetical protein
MMPLVFFALRSRSSTNRSIRLKTSCFVPQYASISGMKVQPFNCRQWFRVPRISSKNRTRTTSPGCRFRLVAEETDSFGFSAFPNTFIIRFIHLFDLALNLRSHPGSSRRRRWNFILLAMEVPGITALPSWILSRLGIWQLIAVLHSLTNILLSQCLVSFQENVLDIRQAYRPILMIERSFALLVKA